VVGQDLVHHLEAVGGERRWDAFEVGRDAELGHARVHRARRAQLVQMGVVAVVDLPADELVELRQRVGVMAGGEALSPGRALRHRFEPPLRGRPGTFTCRCM
jgi:hypothetical protein